MLSTVRVVKIRLFYRTLANNGGLTGKGRMFISFYMDYPDEKSRLFFEILLSLFEVPRMVVDSVQNRHGCRS